jgi:hypothetical protein
MAQQKKNIDHQPAVYGLAARYSSTAAFLKAVRQTAEAGYRRIETYSPFPVEGADRIAGCRKTRVHWAVFFGGLTGGLGGFFMQYIANVSAYPLNIGGRPFNSWPAFIPIAFELTILLGALSGFVAFLIGCRLPEVYHPIFNTPGFGRASSDGFFLCIQSCDSKFSIEQTRQFLEGTGSDEVHVVNY